MLADVEDKKEEEGVACSRNGVSVGEEGCKGKGGKGRIETRERVGSA